MKVIFMQKVYKYHDTFLSHKYKSHVTNYQHIKTQA